MPLLRARGYRDGLKSNGLAQDYSPDGPVRSLSKTSPFVAKSGAICIALISLFLALKIDKWLPRNCAK